MNEKRRNKYQKALNNIKRKIKEKINLHRTSVSTSMRLRRAGETGRYTQKLMDKKKSKVLLRIVSSISFGMFWIVALMMTLMIRAKGPGDAEGFWGAMIGFFTCPVAMMIAWFVYPYNYARYIIFIGGGIGALFFLIALSMIAYDAITSPY